MTAASNLNNDDLKTPSTAYNSIKMVTGSKHPAFNAPAVLMCFCEEGVETLNSRLFATSIVASVVASKPTNCRDHDSETN